MILKGPKPSETLLKILPLKIVFHYDLIDFILFFHEFFKQDDFISCLDYYRTAASDRGAEGGAAPLPGAAQADTAAPAIAKYKGQHIDIRKIAPTEAWKCNFSPYYK